MEPALEALPDDLAALRALILRERAERVLIDAEAVRLQSEAAQLQQEVARLTALTERLDHIIAQLRRLQFGKRSEALDPDQLKLGLEDLESAAAEVEAEEEQADPALCSSTRPGPRSSILAVGAPRPATSGPSPVTIAAATEAIRRRSSTAMRPAAAPTTPLPC